MGVGGEEGEGSISFRGLRSKEGEIDAYSSEGLRMAASNFLNHFFLIIFPNPAKAKKINSFQYSRVKTNDALRN